MNTNTYSNPHNFDLKKFLVENKLTSTSKLNEEDYDVPMDETQEMNTEQPIDEVESSDVSKYLAMESADDIISEIDKEVVKTTMEAKMKKIKEIIEAIDQKVNSLEEDSNVKDYVNPSKIKEMRTMSKKLRMTEDRYMKEYNKKFMSKNKKH